MVYPLLMQWLDHCEKTSATLVILGKFVENLMQGRRIGRFEYWSIQYALPYKKGEVKRRFEPNGK
jgi:hypothetical protein